MRSLNNDMLGCENPLVRELGGFCKTVGEWQNDPYTVLADKAKMEEMNKTGLEFLLKMYYVNKRRAAQEVEKE